MIRLGMGLGPMRHDYRAGELDDAGAEPLLVLRSWIDEAEAAGHEEPNAMAIATASADGVPSLRMVLLKGLTETSLTFFTNYSSRKGLELSANPNAAALFWWPQLERQVRVEGVVERSTREASEAYFRTRPRGSQIGAWASHQSSEIAGREVLEQRGDELHASFAAGEIACPPFWGGFVLTARRVELWQGRADRLHDRLVYRREGLNWRLSRLSP